MSDANPSEKRSDQSGTSVVAQWPTFALLGLCYLMWALGTTIIPMFSGVLAIVIVALAVTLHSSLQHEIIHGHPFSSPRVNAALVFPAVAILIPYLRFRDTHLAHHMDARLTDPYDDPETNYLDPKIWFALPRTVRAVLTFNNTLAGRLLIGPMVSQVMFMRADWQAIRSGDRSVLFGWLWHIPAVLLVVAWLMWVGNMSMWSYAAAAYCGISILKIRTFLEHQAHENANERTVIIEDRGLLAYLFLNNNFHVVHHMHPAAAWNTLPRLYDANRDRYLRRNNDYRYRSYLDVFRRYFLKAKDPVPHPLWPR